MQWPHHGAKNSTRAGLPEFRTTSSKLVGIKSSTEEAALAPVMMMARDERMREGNRAMMDRSNWLCYIL